MERIRTFSFPKSFSSKEKRFLFEVETSDVPDQSPDVDPAAAAEAELSGLDDILQTLDDDAQRELYERLKAKFEGGEDAEDRVPPAPPPVPLEADTLAQGPRMEWVGPSSETTPEPPAEVVVDGTDGAGEESGPQTPEAARDGGVPSDADAPAPANAEAAGEQQPETLSEDARAAIDEAVGEHEQDFRNAWEQGLKEETQTAAGYLQVALADLVAIGDVTEADVNLWLKEKQIAAGDATFEGGLLNYPDNSVEDPNAAGGSKGVEDKPADAPAEAGAPAPKSAPEKPEELTEKQKEALEAVRGKMDQIIHFAEATGGAKDSIDPILEELQPSLAELTDEQINEEFKQANEHLAEKNQEIAKQPDGTWKVQEKVEGGTKGMPSPEGEQEDKPEGDAEAGEEKEKTLMEQFKELLATIIEKINELLKGQGNILEAVRKNREQTGETTPPTTNIPQAQAEVRAQKREQSRQKRRARQERQTAEGAREQADDAAAQLEVRQEEVEQEGNADDPKVQEEIQTLTARAEEAEARAEEAETRATEAEAAEAEAVERAEFAEEYAIWLESLSTSNSQQIQESLDEQGIQGQVQVTEDASQLQVTGMVPEQAQALVQAAETRDDVTVTEEPQGNGTSTTHWNFFNNWSFNIGGQTIQQVGENNTAVQQSQNVETTEVVIPETELIEEEQLVEEVEETTPPVVEKPVEDNTPPNIEDNTSAVDGADEYDPFA